ncbi:MAG: GldG family protein [Burkholderiales bacterium]
MKPNTGRWVYSLGGVLAVLAGVIALNFILGAVPARVDLTEGRIYTLSDGTRKVLGKLEAPVRVRFYFNAGDENVPVPTRAYAARVEDLLREFRAASGGKVQIEKLNPQPDSDAEDSANVDGVEAQVAPSGEKFYLGLAVSQADQKVALPALAPERERLLEYDLVRAIGRVTKADKPVIGVMSGLPVFGMPGNPMFGMQGSDPQVFILELQRDFDVKRVGMDADRIEDGIGTLFVIHPKNITEQAQFALDQFVLRGGKLVVFLDPYAYFDQQPGPMAAMGPSSSNLEALLKGWGLAFSADKVVLDMKYMAGAGPRAVPTVIQLDAGALNPDDVVTGSLGTVVMAFAGVFTGTPAAGLTQTTLMHTSPLVNLVANADAMKRGEEAVRNFKPDGKELALGVRLSGRFKTAFPDGWPARRDDGKGKPPAPDPAPALQEAKGENTVVLIGDSDLLNDGAAVQMREIFGQRVAIPINGNLALVQALAEQLAGDPDLIGLRGRATAARPFTVVKEMEAQAAQAYLGKIKGLEDSLDATRKKLESLQKTTGPAASGAILTAEQQAEVENFRRRAAETRRELKEVRRELRADTEALEFWTKVVNIGAMPLLVAIAGLAIAFVRRRRRAAH